MQTTKNDFERRLLDLGRLVGDERTDALFFEGYQEAGLELRRLIVEKLIDMVDFGHMYLRLKSLGVAQALWLRGKIEGIDLSPERPAAPWAGLN